MTALTSQFFSIREGIRSPQIGDVPRIVSFGDTGPEIQWVPTSLDVKESVTVATVVAGNLATDFEAGDIVDGVTLETGNRFLMKNQVSGIENGIYIVAPTGAPARSSDMAAGSSAAGNFVFVEEGTTNEDAGFVCITNQPNDIVGTDALTFTQYTGAGAITAGAGLTKTGNTINAIANADGSIIMNPDDVQVGTLATDAQHGARSGGAQHADVVAAGASGFMTGGDKAKLNGIEAFADITDTANVQAALSGFTDGSVVFSNGSGLAQDNANLFYNNALNRLGIGTASPGRALDVNGTAKASFFEATNHITLLSQTSQLRFTNTQIVITGNEDNAGQLRFYTGSAERMRIHNAGQVSIGGNVGIGTASPATSAKLEISSTVGALLVSRMTTAQRDALTPVDGMIIYNTTTAAMQGRVAAAWANL